MATTYLHGAYGGIGATQAKSAIQSGTIPVYFGTAPVNLVRGYADSGVINTPSTWAAYTLCEAVSAHFNNPLGNCGPIYIINVLDPDKHRKAEQVEKVLTFTNGRAEFISDAIILDTFALADMAEGTDYSLDYDFTRSCVIVTVKDRTKTTVNATYHVLDRRYHRRRDVRRGVFRNWSSSPPLCSGVSGCEFAGRPRVVPYSSRV